MSKELDDVLLEMAKRDRIAEVFLSLGATHEQAEIAASTPKVVKEFQWTGALLTFQKKAIYKADDGKLVKDWLTANKFDFLIPSETGADAGTPKVDPILVENAKTNWTARGQLLRALGNDQSKLDELKLPPLPTPGTPAAKSNVETPNVEKDESAQKLKGRTNPWGNRPGEWNVTAQARLVREIGLPAAASIAKAAGSFVGATKPNRAA